MGQPGRGQGGPRRLVRDLSHVPPGKEITWGELHVGSVQVFEEAGFAEVARPSPRRVVMRVAFTGGG